MVGQVVAQLKIECAADGKEKLFARLKPELTREVGISKYEQLAIELELSEGAVRVALLRLRRRFGELLRRQITCTVSDPADVEDELRHLMAAMAS